MTATSWPRLTLAEWRDTYETLHRWVQMVGKTRLAVAPMQNHWWNVTLYVTARGLATSPMPTTPHGDRGIDVEFDFIDHRLVARTTDGDVRTMALAPRSVADFYAEYLAMLASLGVRAKIWPVPMEMSDTLRFTEDRVNASYDADAAHRCWQILTGVDRALKEFRGGFLGKSSPSHFWWGAFDISCTRFSGHTAPPHPGGVPNCPDFVTREGYSHECISAGWWPGSAGSPVAEPAFYAYAYPEPAGCATATLRPPAAYYDGTFHEWILPYEAVRTSENPHAAILDFFASTYDAAANLAKWDRAALERGRTSNAS